MYRLLPIAALAAGCVIVSPETVDRDTLTLNEDYESVVIDLPAGDIAVAVGDVTDIRIERIARYRGDDAPELRAEVVDGVVHLSADCRRCSVDHLVVLPHSAPVATETGAGNLGFRHLSSPLLGTSGAGNIEVSGHTGDVDLRTQAGNVELGDVAGELLIETSAGNIIGELVSAEFLDASTQAGNVEFELIDAPMHVSLGSQAGNVSLDLPSGTYAIEAWTSAGRTDIDNLVHDPLAVRSLTLHSSAGNVSAQGF
ncbi:MAG: hypothetical protein KC912_05935 [Proteobacteria bacterium]|nr:hypothetical protein [Pseudomonadota bacterium]